MKLVTMIELLSAVPIIKSENMQYAKNAFIFNALRPDHILILTFGFITISETNQAVTASLNFKFKVKCTYTDDRKFESKK